MRVEMIKNLFSMFPVTKLVDDEFHYYLQKAIREDQVS
jgi:hypothetical protein